VILFTDGLVEARSASGDLFGMARLQRLLNRYAGATSEDLLHRLEEAVMAYSGGDLTDDLAILVLEIKPGITWEPSNRVIRAGT
jgi:serine phosphatase RsbU (regulator of sigma subunit)